MSNKQIEKRAIQLLRNKVTKILSSSVLTSRATLANKLGLSFGGKRDLYEALGYPQLNELTYDDYYGKYRRMDIASRIIEAPVNGAWKKFPTVQESEVEDTSFELEWVELQNKLSIYANLMRGDKLSRIGRYGVILFGFSDTQTEQDMAQPVEGPVELLYLRPYGEGNINIKEWDKDSSSPRYGLPLIYELTNQEPGNITSSSNLLVHYTRVLHIAEGLLDSNVYGLPALERVYNRLLNMEIIVGGSAEMFWQGAFPGYAFIADADATITDSASALEDEIDMFVHDFKRYMKLQGLKVDKLSSDVADPSNHVDVQLTMISAATGIPKRILVGSERGQLASGQDEKHWNDQLEFRQTHHVTPNIIRPMIDRLIEYEVLPAPDTGKYEVMWPDLNTPSDKDRAEVGKIRSESIRNYVSNPDTELIIPFEQFLKEILKMDSETTARIIQAAEENRDRMLEDDGQGDDGLGFQGQEGQG